MKTSFEKGDKLCEECAVFGVSVKNGEAAGITYNALLAMQHRGQEGSGIAVASDNTIHVHKGRGLVGEVFGENILSNLPQSKVAVGHNRYSTTGTNILENVQPFVTEYLTGRIATVHNGNITNAKEIKDKLKSAGVHFAATSDSEVASSLIAYKILETKDVFKAVVEACAMLEGAFSMIVLCGDGNLIAIRDAEGYRPLCMGKSDQGFAVASESCALDSCGFEFIRDILPGEIVKINSDGIVQDEVLLEKKDVKSGLCIFEYVYFARPDSVIDGLSVHESRVEMGKTLAKEYPVKADIVCGVPDSGLEAAAGYSEESGIPLVSGFVKNRYMGRSFIYPTQSQRENAVRLKLNPLKANVKDKSIVLVDDSIVRGTTIALIVQALRKADAKEVHIRISSPPFIYTCHYGTDIDAEEALIANQMSLEEICQKIGADSLGYISLDGLCRSCAGSKSEFCVKCFAGNTKGHRKGDLEE